MVEYLPPMLSGTASNIFAIIILSKFLYKNPEFHFALIGSIAVVFSAVMCFINTYKTSWLNTLSLFIIFAAINHILFKGNVALKLGFSVIVTTVFVISEQLLAFLIMAFSDHPLLQIIENAVLYNIIGFITPVVFLALGLTIAKFFPRKYEAFNRNDMLIILFQIQSMVSMFTVAGLVRAQRIAFIANIMLLLLHIALLASSVLIFFIFDSAAHKKELESQNEFYKYQLEQIKNSQAAIGKIKHDIEKHLLALKLDLQNQHPDEAERKIDSLIGGMHFADNTANSGNADIDAVINYKAKQALEFGIRMVCDLCIPYTLQMNTTDLSVVLGNALDNAVEACRTVDAPSREISVAISYEKSSLRIRVANPFTYPIKTDASGELVTTKTEGRHGIGLKSIREAVEKYDGLMDITTEDNRFVLKILLFNPQSQ